MASGAEKNTLYCICRRPYDETEFMIECEVCKDWFHGSCVGVQEYQAADIEIYHCPNCQVVYGPLTLKTRQNWHRHDSLDTTGSAKAVQTGTVVFIKELKNRNFPSGDEIPVLRMPGGLLTKSFFEENGFSHPILVDKKEGLGMTVPPPSFTIQDVEDHVGSMREIDVIDVSKQEDFKMLMREWTEYYSSPNRDKIFNVISLEFSNTKLSDLVTVPLVVRDISWVTNGVWPDQLPEDTPYKKPEVTKYCLMGVRDSYTDFHIDFGGTSVWYHVLRGEKVFYMVRPTPANLNLYETWLNASNQSELFFGDQVDKCYKCVVKQGQTFFIPTGWIHAVFTPIDSLVFGGNFLHSYNMPMQLEAYAIEKRVRTPEKYLFPSFETINWYAAKHLLDTMRDYIEDSKRPPSYVIDGAKALTFHLRSWTQRKDVKLILRIKLIPEYQFVKTAKHEVPETITYGRVLKELGKIVKMYQETMTTKPSTAKQKSEKKRKKKKSSAVKNMAEIDILHAHTQNRLNEMEIENRKSVYNFEEEEDDNSSATTAKSRRPKAGAFFDSSQESSEPESPEKNKKSLTLKVSNGKIVSERKRKASNKGEFQPFVPSDQDESDEDGLVVDENPKSSRRKGSSQPALKLKLSILNKPSSAKRERSSSDQSDSFSPPHQPIKSPPHHPPVKSPPHQPIRSPPPHQPIRSPPHQPIRSPPHQPISSHVSFPTPKSKTSLSPAAATATPSLSPPFSSTQLQPDLKLKERLPLKPEPGAIKSELTLSDIISQSALSQGNSTLGTKLEPQTDSSEPVTVEQALRMNIPTIRGGLNGSIADILEASGYGTETAFTVDDDINRAPSPSMREAIQGMLSMSRMGGLSGMQLFSRAESRRQAIKARSSLAMEDEEEQLSKCYQDDEYVYPTLEMDEEETEQLLKGHSKPAKDETWNPKARVNITVPLGERQKREGARRESVENSLAASSAKITSQPKAKRPYKKKAKLDTSPPYEAQPGTSSCLSPTHSGSAFRPGLKLTGTSVPTSPTKSRKPKKGQATAKQRLGKILKIHKMGMY